MDQPSLSRFLDHSQPPASETAETHAESGSADAQFLLGLKYANGEGSLQDYGKAAKWFILAAAQGYRGSDTARDAVVLNMTHEDVAETTQRVGKFMISIRGNPARQ